MVIKSIHKFTFYSKLGRIFMALKALDSNFTLTLQVVLRSNAKTCPCPVIINPPESIFFVNGKHGQRSIGCYPETYTILYVKKVFFR